MNFKLTLLFCSIPHDVWIFSTTLKIKETFTTWMPLSIMVQSTLHSKFAAKIGEYVVFFFLRKTSQKHRTISEGKKIFWITSITNLIWVKKNWNNLHCLKKQCISKGSSSASSAPTTLLLVLVRNAWTRGKPQMRVSLVIYISRAIGYWQVIKNAIRNLRTTTSRN